MAAAGAGAGADAGGAGVALLGMGNPLLDLVVDADQAVLDKYELKNGNAILAEEKHLPLYQELAKNKDVLYVAGGATQNSIRVAQWMLQKAGSTAFIGCVGKDAFAKQMREVATADGVAVHYLEDDAPTGSCAVLILNKERSLVANLSAANNYKEAHLSEKSVEPVWQNAATVYISGFFLTVSPPSIMRVAKNVHASKGKRTFCMNISAPFIAQFFSEPLLAALPYVDFLFGNETEAVALGEKLGLKDKSVAAVARHVADLAQADGSVRRRTVVFTQGAESTLVAVGGESGTTSFAVDKLAKEKIVDLNGAGDAFVGGFLARYSQGKPIKECVLAGHYASRQIIQVSGIVVPAGKPEL